MGVMRVVVYTILRITDMYNTHLKTHTIIMQPTYEYEILVKTKLHHNIPIPTYQYKHTKNNRVS